MIEFEEKLRNQAVIKVIGAGGGGSNAINTMIQKGLHGVEFIAANTDMQALTRTLAPVKIQLGERLTKGLGAGAKPDIGREAAVEARDLIMEELKGTDMLFITAGMGGGTGTGGAPVIAEIAREMGVLTVGVVTKPFMFEGPVRRRQAEAGVAALKEVVDTLITIPNQQLLNITDESTSLIAAFELANDVLYNAVRGVSDVITMEGLVNVDFADVKTIMENQGMALMGTGIAAGEGRAETAANQAVNSPLLEDVTIDGATGVLINITGNYDMKLHEINRAATLIQEAADDDVNIIFGAVYDESLGDQIKVTVIATGFDHHANRQHRDSSFAPPKTEKQERADSAPVLRLEPPPRKTPQREHVAAAPAKEESLDIPTFLRRQID
jgi:cell division protein FtsZ